MRLATVFLLLGLLSACSSDGDEPRADPSPTPSTSAAAPTPAAPAPVPANGLCYAMSYDAALAPTSDAGPVPCRRQHTTQTFHVGPLDTVVDGHLLAVDSERVKQQLATACPRRFASYVGGTPEQRRLSVLRPTWFSPTVPESDQGQSWFRCDVVAVSAPRTLAPLVGRMQGVLTTPAGRDRYGLCANSRPGVRGFRHVMCSANDAWRAIATVAVPPATAGRWPGEGAARAAGRVCADIARGRARDPLSFTWGYEYPTEKQWAAGQRHGFCWVPRSN